MTSLELNENSVLTKTKEVGFWRRQFQLEPTSAQKQFDVVCGILLPVACFAFDPIVFRSGFDGAGFLGAYKPFAYLLSYASILGMTGFLLMGTKLKWFNAVLSGLFFLAAVISLAIGIVIFPVSLFGLIFLIGAMGFTPLFTSFVFLRNAVRAFESAGFSLERKVVWHTAMLSTVLSFCLPYLVNIQVANGLKEMAKGDPQTIRNIGGKLWYVAPLVDLRPVRFAWLDTSPSDTERKSALEETYYELTGHKINERPWND